MDWFRRLMTGRNGVDQLTVALLVVSLLMSLIAQGAKIQFLSIITWAIIFLCYYRVFSKNLTSRHQENNAFLKYWYPIQKKLNIGKNRIQGSKDFKYFKCPKCGQNLRVPKGKGQVTISCPKCKNTFQEKT